MQIQLQRSIIVILAVVMCIPFFVKSRWAIRFGSVPAAFPVIPAVSDCYQVSGDIRHAGIYPLSAKLMTDSAIMMAQPTEVPDSLLPDGVDGQPVKNGTVLFVRNQGGGKATVTVTPMNINVKMILGIPLDINVMNVADFDRLSGIGPVMAKRIIEYRQKNGGIMKPTDLEAIEGIGEKKYKQLQQYF